MSAIRASQSQQQKSLFIGNTDAKAEGTEVSAVEKKPFQLDALEATIQEVLG